MSKHFSEILNGDKDWSSFAGDTDSRTAFRGIPVKTLIPTGRVLCRFITAESKKRTAQKIRPNNIYFSPWWTEWTSTARMLNDFKAGKIPPRDILRGRLGITKAHNYYLDGMVQIVLTQSVYAWKGIALYQTDDYAKVTYLGGGEQLYLPNLVSNKNCVTSKFAQMHCWTWVDSLV